jgi:glycine/D-amino acid oxidase-like deaminating enzyme
VWAGSVRQQDEQEVVDPDDYLRTPNQRFRDEVLVGLHHRLPGLTPTGRVPGIAGLYTINRQDVHPVVGPSGVDGFWLAVGFSGHGFKLAPAIGSMMAQALGGSPMEFDTRVGMEFLSVDRQPIGTDGRNVLA